MGLDLNKISLGSRGRYDGKAYDPQFDDARLDKQIGRVFSLMIDGKWRTLQEISRNTGDPESSISAQLRHLRKERFGGYIVNRQPRGNRTLGLFEYQLLEPPRFEKSGQGKLI